MFIEVVKSKIHRVTVTEANLNYIGSITVDEDLLDAANLIANEKVATVNVLKRILLKVNEVREWFV